MCTGTRETKCFKDYFKLPDEEGFTPIGSNKDAA